MYTAQAAAREMTRLGTPGSITLIASMSGSVANKGQHYVAYNASKGAVITMSRAVRRHFFFIFFNPPNPLTPDGL